MENQSLKTKLLILALFIVLIVSATIGFVMCAKSHKPKPGSLFREFTVTYSCGENGHITGNTKQTVREYNDDGTEVTAVPNDGYLFNGWSDNVLVPTRKDSDATENKEITANFISKNKTLKYDYNGATSNSGATSITLNYDNITDTNFIIPQKNGYEFQGWYLDKEFKRRVTDKDGNYYLGKAIFFFEADTVYAKWETTENIVYPVLMIFTYDTQAHLVKKTGDYLDVDYQMNIAEIIASVQVSDKFSEILNDAFNGQVIFDVDLYYTKNIVTEVNYGDLLSGIQDTGKAHYNVCPPFLPEVAFILKDYRSVITTAKNYDGHQNYKPLSGVAENKYAYLSLDYLCYDFNKPFNGFDYYQLCSYVIGYMHEFAHTVEQIDSLQMDIDGLRPGDDNNCAHNYANKFSRDPNNSELYSDQNERELYAYLSFLLNANPEYGKGIPFNFWSGTNLEIEVLYITASLQAYRHIGRIRYENNEKTNLHIYIPYNSDVTVEAIANDGYKFVKWSDGVTTAIRHDKNITSRLVVYPIFEKID